MHASMLHPATSFATAIVLLALAGCAGNDAGRPPSGPSPAATREEAQPAPAHALPPAVTLTPLQAVLQELAALTPVPLETLSAQQARKQPTVGDAVRKVLTSLGRGIAPEAIGRAENRTIQSADGKANMPIRIYWPNGIPAAGIGVVGAVGAGALPVIAYFHGGVWVNGSLDSHDSSARALANAAGAIVVSVHTRQAPEHRFPAAHDDAFAAYQWILLHAPTFGGDPARVAVAGEAAGGNLAASVAIRARDRRIQMPLHQVLIYPILDLAGDTPSRRESHDAQPLGMPTLTWGIGQYLARATDAVNPIASPLRTSDLTGLPPATVITAGIDPLQSEGEAYALRLQQAGIQVDYKNYPGLPHDFFGMGAVVEQAKIAVSQAAAGLKRAFRI